MTWSSALWEYITLTSTMVSEHMTWSDAQPEYILFCHAHLELVSGSDIVDDVSSSSAHLSPGN